MPHQIAPADATALLVEVFLQAEDDHRESQPVTLPTEADSAIEQLFASTTQAYREALIGCAVARVLNSQIDIRYPATEEGGDSFSGRSLADHAITPFMKEKAIPISNSPYLSALRGGAKFVHGGAPRIQRDKEGFEALVKAVDHLRQLNQEEAKAYLQHLLRRFIKLRESADIQLTRIGEPKLEQLGRLISGLLGVKSGGRIPTLLTTAMFQTISECHNLGWQVNFQGINVADAASGAVGDIEVKKNNKIVLGVEVTERPISAVRVKTTFERKVAPNNVRDYLFVTTAEPQDSAKEATRSYTAVGHEMNFVQLRKWLIDNLASIGPECRAIFQAKMIDLLSAGETPAQLRVAWNTQMDAALGIGPKPAT